MRECYIEAASHHLPERVVSNTALSAERPGWNAAKISAKTGIDVRPVAPPDRTASDLAVVAAESLFAREPIDRATIDAVILCTQSPDYVLPSSACLLQHRLGLRDDVAAFDVNLACSGLPYMLWLGRSLIASEGASRVLLLFGDTYSRYCDPDDLGTASIFSDGAAAVLLGTEPGSARGRVGPSRLGTDGSGAPSLIVADGGARARAEGRMGTVPTLVMDGPEIFRFALDRVKPQVDSLLASLGLGRDEIDRWFMHQANRFMLDSLRTKLGIPRDRMPIDLADVGNAATASLPILVSRQLASGAFERPCRSLVVGFGVGFSWASTYVEWV